MAVLLQWKYQAIIEQVSAWHWFQLMRLPMHQTPYLTCQAIIVTIAPRRDAGDVRRFGLFPGLKLPYDVTIWDIAAYPTWLHSPGDM
ncbi:hypothetical protein A1F99_026750 [Pyrenophora tritici-repentis]|nr:hypothetical protein A1F99_026750 [Pyrenophora tritici-repentis]